jgi:DNA-directed RNA polymerase specialized sigma24 family protein
VTRTVPPTDTETTDLERALINAVISLDGRRDPITRAMAAGQVADRLNQALAWVSERRRHAVAQATTLPGMTLSRLGEEMGVPKSTVAKLAGPAGPRTQMVDEVREQMLRDIEAGRGHPVGGSRFAPSRPAFDYGANEGKRRR